MGQVRDKNNRGTTISKGLIVNRMCIDAYSDLFKFKVFVSHEKCWRNFNEQDIIDLELAFWTIIAPNVRNNDHPIDILIIHDANPGRVGG